MTNAAIYMHMNAYSTAGARLLGRHAAGESFLRGYLRHADVPRYWFYNAAASSQADFEALIAAIEPPLKPVTWINAPNRRALAEAGVLNLPVPEITTEAWQRRTVGGSPYGICGITHTTATTTVMDIVTDMAVAPVEDYDALICTSAAVRASVEAQMEMMRSYMSEIYGPRRRPEVQRVTIPLGVNASDYARSPQQRKAWRDRLEIPDDAVVALYVGRFNVRAKMNPALMAMALERAAQRTTKPLCWISAGWAEQEADGEVYHRETAALCPSVRYIAVDGREPDTQFSIWSAADFFISFSDNIQETFGLTPIEAMAAGLPAVVTDWNGYKDTVRHGVDGFRIPTMAPGAGMGGDLAYWFANRWLSYDHYVGATAQLTAIDLAEAERAIVALVDDPDLRQRMGDAARTWIAATFDWSAVIPQYQDLWADQDARRRLAAAQPARPNPRRPDPFSLFASYPSRALGRGDRLTLSPGVTWTSAKARLEAPLAIYSRFGRPTDQEVEVLIARLNDDPGQSVAALVDGFPAARRNYVERGLLWLARHDILAIEPALGNAT